MRPFFLPFFSFLNCSAVTVASPFWHLCIFPPHPNGNFRQLHLIAHCLDSCFSSSFPRHMQMALLSPMFFISPLFQMSSPFCACFHFPSFTLVSPLPVSPPPPHAPTWLAPVLSLKNNYCPHPAPYNQFHLWHSS
jgi:hypothetical protein